ncbi:MAG: sulfite exporter TauE/SafE family protein, partial [Betaproteobacteria bacterium]|nr:sulfite exporter TauE/SafE family protein [Betaproteobacteria bacterium]
MDIQVLMVLGLTGAIVGFMAGLLGLGGGLLMVPVLSFLLANTGVAEDLSIKMAIVTSM